MSISTCRIRGAAILIAASLSFPAAHAQLGDLIKQKDGSGLSGGLGNPAGLTGALSGQSVTSGSLGNVAGLLEFCIKNNYLGGNKAASVKDSLMRKLPGGSSTTDSGYSSGAKGILSSSDGSQLDLSTGGVKKQLTKQICDKILDQGKSML